MQKEAYEHIEEKGENAGNQHLIFPRINQLQKKIKNSFKRNLSWKWMHFLFSPLPNAYFNYWGRFISLSAIALNLFSVFEIKKSIGQNWHVNLILENIPG